MNDKRAHVSVWPNKNGALTLYLSGAGLTSSLYITPEEAAQLIKDLQRALTEMPRTVNAADLGLEAA